jgi:multimeric flavodoxin WrbA
MKIVAFNGSPRSGGNTELLLAEAVGGARSQGAAVSVYRLDELDLRPCRGCGGCADTARCVIADAMQEIHAALREADRVILASPVYFFSVSAQTKIMIDRCQAFWAEKYVRKKPVIPGPFGRKGLLILVGGMRKDAGNKGFECAGASARAFFRTINVQEHATLEYEFMDEKGAVSSHPTALDEARANGIKLAT